MPLFSRLRSVLLQFREKASRPSWGAATRSWRPIAKCIHSKLTDATPNNNMKQLVHTSTRSFIRPNANGQGQNHPALRWPPTAPPTVPT